MTTREYLFINFTEEILEAMEAINSEDYISFKKECIDVIATGSLLYWDNFHTKILPYNKVVLLADNKDISLILSSLITLQFSAFKCLRFGCDTQIFSNKITNQDILEKAYFDLLSVLPNLGSRTHLDKSILRKQDKVRFWLEEAFFAGHISDFNEKDWKFIKAPIRQCNT